MSSFALTRESTANCEHPHGSLIASILDWGPEIRVMFRPSTAYQALAGQPPNPKIFRVLQRPLFVAFLLGCMVSLITSQCLTLRHVAGGTINASFVLVGQIAALAVVCGHRNRQSFAHTIDLFFLGYGPWCLWVLIFSAAWAFAPPVQAFVWVGMPTILPTASLVAICSAYIDFCFFRHVLQKHPIRAVWDALVLRAISWSVAILIFGYGPLSSELMKLFGR